MMAVKYFSTLCVLLSSIQTEVSSARIFPSSYYFPRAEAVSVNGSSATGHCSSVATGSGTHSECNQPTTSVLFDGYIPTLTGLDGDMWASQLLTLRGTGFQVVFHFTATPRYAGVGRIEVVMFSCPEWGVAVQTIRIYASSPTSRSNVLLGTITPTVTSCNSLVRVCIPVSTTEPIIALGFFPRSGSGGTYLAEVAFSSDTSFPCTTSLLDIPSTTATPAPDSTPTVTAASFPTLALTTSSPTLSEGCPSCTRSTALAAVITALLATVTFVLVQIAVCKCRPRFTPGGAETGTSAGGEEREYEQVEGGEGGVAMSEPTNMEVGGGGGGNTFKLKKNEAYASHLHSYCKQFK